MIALLMTILEQFLRRYLGLPAYWLYVLIDPHAITLLSSLMHISKLSSISPPTLSKQTSNPLGQYSFIFCSKLSVLQSIVQSAPIDLMQSHFYLELAIPITVQPSAFASWTASSPTAPAAAETTTISPFLRLPIFLYPKYAVNPDIPKTPRKSEQSLQLLGRRVSSFAFMMEYFCQQVSPKTLSPILNLGSFVNITSPTPMPFIRSPGFTGSMQVLTPEIHILIVASIDKQRFLTTTSPCWTRLIGVGGTYLSWNTSSL